MAISASVYGTLDQVSSYLRDIIGMSGDLSANSRPTLAEVEDAINSAGGAINDRLKVFGYAVPVTEQASPEAFSRVRMVNSMGAVSIILSSRPTEDSYTDPATGRLVFTRRAFFEQKFQELLMDIEMGRFSAETIGFSDNKEIIIGSERDSQGRRNLALFKRSTFDYPGSRRLSE